MTLRMVREGLSNKGTFEKKVRHGRMQGTNSLGGGKGKWISPEAW